MYLGALQWADGRFSVFVVVLFFILDHFGMLYASSFTHIFNLGKWYCVIDFILFLRFFKLSIIFRRYAKCLKCR